MENDPFFRFPHTPHLAWLGRGTPRDDKVLSPADAAGLLAGDVVIEEKLDGANLGLSLDGEGRLRSQNRGHYLHAPFGGQFARLPDWLAMHEERLAACLNPTLIALGSGARRSIHWTTTRCRTGGCFSTSMIANAVVSGVPLAGTPGRSRPVSPR